MPRAWSRLVIAVVIAFAAPIVAILTDPSSSLLDSVFPLQQNAGTTGLFPMPLCHGFKLEEATIDQMQQALSRGQLSSQELVTCYLQRIYQTDRYIK